MVTAEDEVNISQWAHPDMSRLSQSFDLMNVALHTIASDYTVSQILMLCGPSVWQLVH